MSIAAPTPIELRQARAILAGDGAHATGITPRHLVSVAKETGKTFGATLKYLVLLLSGGSGVGPARIATADRNRIDPVSALGDNTPSRQMEYDNVPK